MKRTVRFQVIIDGQEYSVTLYCVLFSPVKDESGDMVCSFEIDGYTHYLTSKADGSYVVKSGKLTVSPETEDCINQADPANEMVMKIIPATEN